MDLAHRFLLRALYVLTGLVTLAWLGLTQAEAALSFPPLTGRVVDESGVLSDGTKAELTGILAKDEKKFDGRQIVVVTLKSLEGTTIEDYGYQLGRHWGIGQKGKDNGALIIVAPNEHKVRIEVGYGLEGDLTDAESRIIIDTAMLPEFKKGNYDAGVLAGTKAVLATLGNTDFTAPDYDKIQSEQDHSPPGFITILIIFAIIILFAGRSFFWPLFFMGGFGGGWGGGGWSGGGGGGGFSGGGGSFGGGGASGSW